MALKRTAEKVKSGVEESPLGFSLVEVVVAATVLTVALGGLGALLVSMTQQRAEMETRTIVAMEAQNRIEEITSTDPSYLQSAYDGVTYPVSGVVGVFQNGDALSVRVVYEETELLAVTLTGAWTDEGFTRTFVLYTEIFDG